MKQTTASNVALALALLAWPFCFYGALSQLGDFAPDTPRDVIDRHKLVSSIVLSTGLFSLFVSLVLSGFGFSGARYRAVTAIAVCFGLLLVVVAGMLQ
ncbi:hypothetical protein [Noviluteimonas gilva]|uniref:DUF998 domain-containing protein n=1 Tax=Noviluteimonas gilva TaxID=2682097 RepID=A0A7C9M4D0_9GAMM|nr:hypothetical protein [Lysobacter gilvus]MUV14622.1 hypothetical protein [Lysobacter gilvus]